MSPIVHHFPVLGDEVVKYVVKNRGGIYIDATFGGGGHSKFILDILSEEGRLIAFDIDNEAIERGKKLEEEDKRFKIVKCNFADIDKYLSENNIGKVDGIVFDLGLSTFQLLSNKRGFSFKEENAFLDMRMNTDSQYTAAEVLNYSSRNHLNHIFKRYGEINNPSKLINNISIFRKQYGSISTIGDFLDIINESWDGRVDFNKFVRQCFQAVRIEVNRELDVLEKALDSLQRIVKPQGVVAIVTFHSLEDEKVRAWKKKLCDDIQIQDYAQNFVNQFSFVTNACVFPTELEKSINWASRSAKLWVAQKN
ncbi:ribosomal RNA small subunit methyltransferase H [Candidatus Mycoplasma haematohominis]|uniref:Ribosomal RNA small subunit methyltransferase H n=1 Tax=Candidatus Mycoplasma haematohominis TaxID=1494318 RepID=A0A478FRN2_9MOLU|nr:ribosomal RNA small subunit methyltransferase H [Candidatus Mycoplasma haemohominis]